MHAIHLSDEENEVGKNIFTLYCFDLLGDTNFFFMDMKAARFWL